MGYGDYLKDLLRPLGVYDMTGIGGGELDGVGAVLDGCAAALEHAQREMLLATAQDDGLTAMERLLARRPVTDDKERRRAALAALLRVGGDSFTLGAINDNLKGCGLNAVASEGGGKGKIQVRFPEVPGIPDGFPQMRQIIEDILPCHLEPVYIYWYITWITIESKFSSWAALEARGLTWDRLEKLAT